MKLASRAVFLLFVFTLFAHKSFAVGDLPIAATLGASYEAGQLGNNGLNLEDRTMTALAFEALPGYLLNSKWLIGLDLNYQFQQQQTSLADAGNSNLAGKAWLVGLGAQHRLSEKWALQAAFYFLGNYDLDQQTTLSQDTSLKSPLGARIKAQYFILDQWTVDGVVDYLSWRKMSIANNDISESSDQWMVGAGITYHFGFKKESSSTDVAVEPTKKEDQVAELSKIAATEKTDTGIQIKLEGGGFPPGKSDINEDLKLKIKAMAAVLVKDQSQKIRIEGHTDSTGSAEINKKLSQSRAEAVQSLLVENGVNAARINVLGKGSENPIADNKTAQGRAQNRRIEIKLEEGL